MLDQHSPTLFDLAEGERLKTEGMAVATDMLSRKFLLQKARDIALVVASNTGHVTADDVYREMEKRGYDITVLGNAAGSIFKEKFVFTGQWIKSKRTTNHARMIRVWRRA